MDVVQAGCISVFQLLGEWYEQEERKRRWGTHPFCEHSKGLYHTMFQYHRLYPDFFFFQYYIISVTTFDELLFAICDKIKKEDTHFKKSIEPVERLVITLR